MSKVLFLALAALFVMPATPNMSLAGAVPVSLQQPAAPKSQTFTGTITKQGDKYILADAANKLSYALDDVKQAGQYEGKKVKVTGTVDLATNSIHVLTIQEIA
jgi:uncharacterized protein YdeI (BOF family)